MASNRTPLNGLGPVVPGTSRTIPMVTAVNRFRMNTPFSVCNEHVVALSPVSTSLIIIIMVFFVLFLFLLLQRVDGRTVGLGRMYRGLRDLQQALNKTQSALDAAQGPERQLATVYTRQARVLAASENESGLSFDTELAGQLLAQCSDAFGRLASMISNAVCSPSFLCCRLFPQQ